jgi:hypothetical protein
MQGGGDARPGRVGAAGGGRGFAVAAVAAVATVAGLVAADHVRAREEGRESGVQAAFRWFAEDVLGVDAGGAGPSGGGGTGRRRGAGLSRAEIDALPVRTFCAADVERAQREQREGTTPPEKQMCAICQDHFIAGDSLMRLECLHEYHEDCISSFLSSSSQPFCPCCRHPVNIR